MKKCPRCKVTKDHQEWSQNKTRPDGMAVWCKSCMREYACQWYKNNREKRLAKGREWEQANWVDRLAYKSRLRKGNPHESVKRKKYHWRLKLEMINAYGGECVCCQETLPEFLTINHKFNDGNLERAELKKNKRCSGGLPFYAMLKKAGWPQDRYELMCMNCNTAIGFFGYCPHQVIKELENEEIV